MAASSGYPDRSPAQDKLIARAELVERVIAGVGLLGVALLAWTAQNSLPARALRENAPLQLAVPGKNAVFVNYQPLSGVTDVVLFGAKSENPIQDSGGGPVDTLFRVTHIPRGGEELDLEPVHLVEHADKKIPFSWGQAWAFFGRANFQPQLGLFERALLTLESRRLRGAQIRFAELAPGKGDEELLEPRYDDARNPRLTEKARIEVEVLNGASRSGLAGDVAEHLARKGLSIRTVGNDKRAWERTVVVDRKGDIDAALKTRDALGWKHVPVWTRLEKGNWADVTVILGEDAATTNPASKP